LPPRVVILGAGFAGLAAARALGSSRAHVTIIDRRNYHLFVPLLYQVATAALSPADIAEPIRKILRRHKNVEVLLGAVTGIDREARTVRLADGGSVGYDSLIVATGSSYNYFAHPEWEAHAPGLKTIADARKLRSRLLSAFELAEREPDPQRQRDLMTTVVVGGGPTGVEMAGSIAELARYTLARDFRHVDPASARVLLIEAGPRILAAFPERLARYAHERLERLGVEILCKQPVEDIGPAAVRVAGKEIAAGTVIWGAGIRASAAGAWLGADTDRIGRVRVNEDLSVPGMDGVYVIGDSALCVDAATGEPLPALAQVSQQQGRHLGRELRRHVANGTALRPFRFNDRGNTAIVGRNAAIFDFGSWRLRGWPAWMLWAIVHIYLLVGFEKRLLVSLQWLWRYLTFQRGARLITGDSETG
jgi:NADH dehydrogenase